MSRAERQLLRWQSAVQADYLAKRQRDYLLVAVPGAGKTFWAMHTARELIRSGHIQKVVVVAPTTHVKHQWATTAHELGLNIAPDYRNTDGWWPRDADGVAITYAQMASESLLCHANVSKHPTLAVNDEPHHMYYESSWGKSAQDAFGMAAYRIHLSGTPWNKSGFIPWVEYGPDNVVKPDMTYSYRESLTDGVNCDVFFPEYEGRAEWDFDGERVSRGSGDPMSERDQARWLTTILTVPGSNFITKTFIEADAELSRIRDLGQVTAGGMIIAKDVDHADKIADYIHDVLRKPRPVVITSDKPRAGDDLKTFRRSTERWCISVRMVSEGVDIPRLRVLIYATNYTTRLFFRQAVGRVIRGPEPPAKVYLPAHSQLVEFAKEFRDERLEALQKIRERLDCDREERVFTPFSPVRGEVTAAGIIHADGIVSQAELDYARRQLITMGDTRPNTEMVTLLAKYIQRQGTTTTIPCFIEPPAPDSPLQSDRKDALRRATKKIVSQLCNRTGREYSHAYAELNRLLGVKKSRDCDEEQLRKRYEIAKQWLDEAMAGDD